MVWLLLQQTLFFLFCRFFFADKAVGAKGFKAIWTEFKDTSNCQEFRCAKSQICISRTLRCNGINNCGHMDTSDEMNCVTESEVIITLLEAKLKDKKCMKWWCSLSRYSIWGIWWAEEKSNSTWDRTPKMGRVLSWCRLIYEMYV